MKQIAKNEYYEIHYDESNNWVYWTMRGFWKSMQVVPDFEKDWATAIQTAKKPFKIFADLSKLSVMPDDVKNSNDLMQQKLLQNGCEKVSCLMESTITKMSLNQVIKQSGMEKIVQYFVDPAEAKQWLAS